MTILGHIENYPVSIPAEQAGALISIVCEDPDLFSLQDRTVIVDSVNGKTCKDDPELDDKLADDPELDDTLDYAKQPPQQWMCCVENYFTQSIWDKLSDPKTSEMPYLSISMLLVHLGMHRPRVEFWDLLVGTLQWAMEGRLSHPLHERDRLKDMFAQFRGQMYDEIAEAPTEYPMLPNTLAETYPHLYHRSYQSSDPPILPPSTLDTHPLNVLKATTTVPHRQPRHLG